MKKYQKHVEITYEFRIMSTDLVYLNYFLIIYQQNKKLFSI